jgi:hypothetical protein
MYLTLKMLLFLLICFSSCRESKKDDNAIEINIDDHHEIRKVFYEGGNLKNKFQVNLLEQKDGESREFYENGKVKSISYYNNGLLDSFQYWFYPNGIKQAEIFRLNGRKFGSQKMYDSSGNLEAVYFVTSKCDSCIASIIYFNPDGSIKQLDGHMVYCVYEKEKVNVGDTAKLIFYVIEPDFIKTSSMIIEEKKNRYFKQVGVTLDFYNNNKGFLFLKKFDSSGEYRIGIKVNFFNTKSMENFDDSIFISFKVVSP